MKHKTTNSSRRLLSLILLCSLPFSALAQSTEEKTETTGEDQQEQVTAQPVSVSTQKPAKSIKAKSAESADTYEATEEISEDLSVSYPVDI